MFPPSEPSQLVSDLCRRLYELGWATGTGGGFSLRMGERVFMAPSGVQKEHVSAADVFELDLEGRVTVRPANAALKLSECAPLFMHAFRLRDAGAVLHSHGMYAMLASLAAGDTFECTELEMIKGIAGHGYFDRLVVPIIENTAHEHELADRLADAMRAYPRTQAVLVRRHGVYVWGRDWVQAKTQAECYHYVFEASVRMAALGIDAGRAAHVPDLGLVGGGAT